MTFSEAKQALAGKLNISFTDIANNDLFSATDLGLWIQQAAQFAWDYKPWPFTKGAKTFTTVDADYYDNPTDFALDSTFRVTVGGYRYKRLDFDDYQQTLEDNPTCTDRIWAAYGNYIFINKNAYTVGDTGNFFGKEMLSQLSGDSDLMPFSPQIDGAEHSGNDAIVQLAYAEALDSEKLNNPVKAASVRKKATGILDQVWQPYADTGANAQNSARPMFDLPDMFADGATRRGSPGNFNL
jgi:hypothetical protein